MTPKEFYTSSAVDPSRLEFGDAKVIVWPHPEELPPRNLPGDNTVVFEGPDGLFTYAAIRLSTDGGRMEVASLFGSLSVPSWGLDLSKPIGMLCVKDGLGIDCAVCQPTRDWAPVSAKALGRMKAKPLSSGKFEPISSTMVLRGMEGTLCECHVVLPAEPSAIRKVGAAVEIEADGLVFVVSDKVAVKLILDGVATWVVPDERGVFKMP